MKPTPVCLVLFCLLTVFASTCWAAPIDVSASIVGSISGRGGIDQATYSITLPSQTDFDSVKAEVGPHTLSGGDGVSTGSLAGSAFASHPGERGEPGFLEIDLLGSFTATRTPTGGAESFFPAGSMLVGAQAIAEYRDEITIEKEHDDGAPVTTEGFVSLMGLRH